jgi:hypothetical protein
LRRSRRQTKARGLRERSIYFGGIHADFTLALTGRLGLFEAIQFVLKRLRTGSRGNGCDGQRNRRRSSQDEDERKDRDRQRRPTDDALQLQGAPLLTWYAHAGSGFR